MTRFSVFLPFALLLWAGTASTAPLSASDRIRQGLAAFNAEDYQNEKFDKPSKEMFGLQMKNQKDVKEVS